MSIFRVYPWVQIVVKSEPRKRKGHKGKVTIPFYEVQQMRFCYALGWTFADIARMFGHHETYVRKLCLKELRVYR